MLSMTFHMRGCNCMKSYLLVPLMIVMLSACSDSHHHYRSGPPGIHDIKTDIIHWHTNFVSVNIDQQAPLSFSVSAAITDPGGLSDLDDVYIQNDGSARRWYLVGGPDQVRWYHYFDSFSGFFEYRSFDPDSPDAITLNGWELVVIDREGNEVRQAFDFMLPDGLAAADGVKVYAADYATPAVGDVPALEAMSTADNAMSITSDEASSSFQISFQSSDSRAVDYSIDFYTALPDRRRIGHASKYVSPAIEATPLVAGVTTNLTLPWNEVYFFSGLGASNVASMRITLLGQEEPGYWEGAYWISYLGVSEIVDRL